MKLFPALGTLLLAMSPLIAQEKLSDIDRELLLERLKEIQETSNTTVKSRFGAAIAAFKEGMSSDTAANDLYLKCIEKVRFQDEAKKTNEFREWKRRHKDRTDSAGFRRALRHQLHWIVITLEAAQDPESIPAMGTRGKAVIEAILKDADVLKGQERLLRGKAMESVFATAYSVNNAAPAAWPTSPLDIATIYEVLVLPPLRTPETLQSLRQGWLKRIEHEGLILESWTEEGSDGKDRKPAFEKWLMKGRHDLTWAMEIDLFNNGDQKKAAIRMLDHLKENLNHESAPKWIKQFTALVKGEPLVPEEEEE